MHIAAWHTRNLSKIEAVAWVEKWQNWVLFGAGMLALLA